jgi:hypothetical protein
MILETTNSRTQSSFGFIRCLTFVVLVAGRGASRQAFLCGAKEREQGVGIILFNEFNGRETFFLMVGRRPKFILDAYLPLISKKLLKRAVFDST